MTDISATLSKKESNVILFYVALSAFLIPVTLFSVFIAIPSILEEFNQPESRASQIPTIYLSANIAFLLVFSKLADRYGRRRIHTIGVFVITAGTFTAAFAQSFEHILVCVFLQGFGTAMLSATGMAIIGTVFQKERRGFAMSMVVGAIYIGSSASPTLGGWATELFGWRSVFIMPLPFAIIPLLTNLFIKADWRLDDPGKVDWIGAALFAVASGLLVLALEQLPSLIGSIKLSVAFVLYAVFIWRQSKQKSPLVRVQLFLENKIFATTLLSGTLLYCSVFSLSLLLSLYLQSVLFLSAAIAGNIIFVEALSRVLATPIAGKMTDAYDERKTMLIGALLTLFGFITLYGIGQNTEALYICLALALIGTGVGLFSTPIATMFMGAVQPEELGVSTVLLNMGRIIGNLVGVSFIGIIIRSKSHGADYNNIDTTLLLVC
jgi:MFS family permease